MVTTEFAVPGAQLLGLGLKLYPCNMQRMLNKDFTRFTQNLSRIRQIRASEKKDLLAGYTLQCGGTRGRSPVPPLFLAQTEARRADKNFLRLPPPPPLPIWRSGSATALLSFRQYLPFDRLVPYLWSFIRIQLHGHERSSSFFIQCTVLALPKEVSHFIAADIFVAGLFSLERFNACEFHTILPPHHIPWKCKKVQFGASEIRSSMTKGTMAASIRYGDLWDCQGAKSSSSSSSSSSLGCLSNDDDENGDDDGGSENIFRNEFHVVVVQWTSKKSYKKRDARAELLFWSLNLLLFDVVVVIVVVVVIAHAPKYHFRSHHSVQHKR